MNLCCEKWKGKSVFEYNSISPHIARYCPECGSELNQSKWCECSIPNLGREVFPMNRDKCYTCDKIIKLETPKITKMPHYGYDLANKNWKEIIKNVWGKLDEIIDVINCKVL